MIKIWCRVTDDGYLAYATTDERGAHHRYWPDYYDSDAGDDLDIVAVTVPGDVADLVVLQGTGEQHFDDGYDAWSAVQPYYTE